MGRLKTKARPLDMKTDLDTGRYMAKVCWKRGFWTGRTCGRAAYDDDLIPLLRSIYSPSVGVLVQICHDWVWLLREIHMGQLDWLTAAKNFENKLHNFPNISHLPTRYTN